MSWPDRRRAVALLAAAAATGGCGFRPLYGEAGGGDLLGQVEAVGLKGRSGYHFGEQLRRRVGRPEPDAALQLRAALTFDREGLAISATDDVTRYDVIGTARYTLARRRDGAVVAEGTVTSITAYSTTATPYATEVARRDAERRLAVDLADRVFARIAALDPSTRDL
jgi:LPS-assembly lipoprotein